MATTAVRPAPPTLETPQSGTFPSEIASPLVASPMVLRPEFPLGGMKTPLTPPPAYLDFLAKKSPGLSPPASATLFPRPLMAEKPALTSTPSTESFTSTKSSASTASTASIASESSVDTTTEASASNSNVMVTVPTEITESEKKDKNETEKKEIVLKEEVKEVKVIAPIKTHTRRISMPPPSPFGPTSARSPRRLVIPQSPYSPRIQSPLSAGGMVSPYAIVSPRGDREVGAPGEFVSVKQVVTRTMHMVRPSAPIMEPVPASKKRKFDAEHEKSRDSRE